MASSSQIGLWNSTIRTYLRQKQTYLALQSFHQMLQESVLGDMDMFISLLSACANMNDINLGKKTHACMCFVNNALKDTRVGNALVNMYGKCGSIEDALHIFDIMQQRDLISWSAMVSVYAKHGHDKASFHMFRNMQEEGILPNRVTFISVLSACAHSSAIVEGKRIHSRIIQCGGDVVLETALVNFYGKCGKLNDAQDVFDKMTNQDVVAWNAIITVSVHDSQGQLVFHLFNQMQSEGFRPDRVTFTSMIDACANHLLFGEGMHLHAYIMEEGFDKDIVVATGLFDMYGRCGSIEDSWQVFNSMKKKDLVAWNALSTGYARHGKSNHVFDLCSRMQEEGLQPNEITWLSLLSVCRHAGLVDKGQALFETMRREAGIVPNMKHYSCTIDLLGRAGRLDEIVPLMEEMPFEPNLATWHTIMSACQKYGDVQLGRKAFACARSLGEKHAGTYVFMSNIFADYMVESDIY